MRIAFVVGRFPAISETFILNQITGLIDRGHEVHIYANEPGNESAVQPDVQAYRLLERTHYRPAMPPTPLVRLLKGSVLVMRHVWRGPGSVLRTLNVFKYGRRALTLELLYAVVPWLRSGPYDIIHCHFGPNGLRAALLRDIGALHGKLVTTFHGYDVHRYPRQFGVGVYGPLFACGDIYTVNTTFTGDKVRKLGCPETRIVKLSVGVDMAACKFVARSMAPGDPVRVMTVARLVEKKGLEYSIRAVAKVAQRHPDLVYRIVGDGPLRESLSRLIVDLGVPRIIQLLGWKTQGEVRELYRSAHIFVLSSVLAADGDQEGQGLVLQEAQAMGIPVVSTLHNGLPEGVLDGVSGFLVPERDVDALAKKLTYLIEHPEVWPEMGRAGRRFVEERYDIAKLNDRLVEIYKRALNKQQG